MAKTISSRRGILFKEPFGKSERFKFGNKHEGTLEDITCELCGTNFPERERREGNWLSPASFLGHQCVMECCGKVFDLLYEESAQDFTEQLLIDFSKAPDKDDYKQLR
ncbi:MAG: hypothetical protein Q8Q46_03330, partial [Candidatus Giovannonibacteria bacterium]|nr:hypothetical protein [Candidatus Giovannonibacteria bacterium]